MQKLTSHSMALRARRCWPKGMTTCVVLLSGEEREAVALELAKGQSIRSIGRLLPINLDALSRRLSISRRSSVSFALAWGISASIGTLAPVLCGVLDTGLELLPETRRVWDDTNRDPTDFFASGTSRHDYTCLASG